MDRKAAEEAMTLLSDAANGVRDALVIVRKTLPSGEAEAFRKAAGQAVLTIATELMDIIVRHHPDLDPSTREI
jgi:hypothetical protein